MNALTLVKPAPVYFILLHHYRPTVASPPALTSDDFMDEKQEIKLLLPNSAVNIVELCSIGDVIFTIELFRYIEIFCGTVNTF